jgi:hypothetical protein
MIKNGSPKSRASVPLSEAEGGVEYWLDQCWEEHHLKETGEGMEHFLMERVGKKVPLSEPGGTDGTELGERVPLNEAGGGVDHSEGTELGRVFL